MRALGLTAMIVFAGTPAIADPDVDAHPWGFGFRYATSERAARHGFWRYWPNGDHVSRRINNTTAIGADFDSFGSDWQPGALSGLLPIDTRRTRLMGSIGARIGRTSANFLELVVLLGAGVTWESIDAVASVPGAALSLSRDGLLSLASTWRPHAYAGIGAEHYFMAGSARLGIGVEVRGYQMGGSPANAPEPDPGLPDRILRVSVMLDVFPADPRRATR